MSGIAGKVISAQSAIDWIRYSLSQGTELAQLVSRSLPSMTRAVLLVPPSWVQEAEPTLDKTGRDIPMSESVKVARSLLARLGATSVMTLVVEDDVRRRGHRHVGHAAFIDDPVLYWEHLDDRGERAARLLREGAYLLNAYLLQGWPADYGLVSDKELSDRDLAHNAEATRGVIVSVWDDEALVALLAPQLRL